MVVMMMMVLSIVVMMRIVVTIYLGSMVLAEHNHCFGCCGRRRGGRWDF
jgi:uncharacterized membrane protein